MGSSINIIKFFILIYDNSLLNLFFTLDIRAFPLIMHSGNYGG